MPKGLPVEAPPILLLVWHQLYNVIWKAVDYSAIVSVKPKERLVEPRKTKILKDVFLLHAPHLYTFYSRLLFFDSVIMHTCFTSLHIFIINEQFWTPIVNLLFVYCLHRQNLSLNYFLWYEASTFGIKFHVVISCALNFIFRKTFKDEYFVSLFLFFHAFVYLFYHSCTNEFQNCKFTKYLFFFRNRGACNEKNVSDCDTLQYSNGKWRLHYLHIVDDPS